ncbi:MAG: peptide chain release factor N(5)-glutamine methyltransferase [Lactobacillales bacterium]|jgi:release factor glutamine methyltransferase|nr:peptide chain release factor N(5)-glutamine methyltransferase [Lactobacillales bacterium]
MKKTYFQAVKDSSSRIDAAGLDPIDVQFVLMERKNWDKTQWVMHLHEAISKEDYLQLLKDEAQLLNYVPPQYLIGSAEFFGRRFKVTRDTLIPRPETEELVQMALSKIDANRSLKVVDIGVGSGVIAISLALERSNWQMWGVDLYERALEVAKENGEALNANVQWVLGDVLNPFLRNGGNEKFDLIISNPPYVSYGEWNLMDVSVRQYEPREALFAEDYGLAVYRKIAKQAPLLLKDSGILLLEIGYAQGEAVSQMMDKAFGEECKVEVLNDLSGKPRMICVHKSET